MTINTTQIYRLSDRELLRSVQEAAQAERQSSADLLALLGELDERRLYLGEGCSSLFTYCTQVLRLSEHAAYHRIEVSRLARQFPAVLEMVARGDITLTNAALLKPHLTPANHEVLLANARHKSKREVEYQIACLAPRSDATPLVRRIVEQTESTGHPNPAATGNKPPTVGGSSSPTVTTPQQHVSAAVKPSAPDRYLLKVTISAEAHAKLRKAQDLLRHSVPNGDPAAIVDRALTVLVEQLERAKIANVRRPVKARPAKNRRQRSRHIPASVKRAVWRRDRGRCAFVGSRGRCRETGRLEFHHIVPFADGGATDVTNLSLRCRAHNGYENERWSMPQWTDGRTEAQGAMT
jgi:5-methylcytosine-specific restriction endonuclease McrA